MITTLATVAGLVIGFIGGLCAYRSSRRWCGGCGRTLTCQTCADPAARTSRAAGAVDHPRQVQERQVQGQQVQQRSVRGRPARRTHNSGPAGA